MKQITIVLFAITFLITSCKKPKENEASAKEKSVTIVTTYQVKDTVFKHYVEVQGSVKTKDDASVFPEMAGVMTRLFVKEGQYVKRGALVAKVDDGGMSQQIAQQEVQLELARTTYERQKRLWEQNIGSEIQYLQAKSNVEALEKAIEAQQKQLSKVNVYAPFSGYVEEIITKQGQVVSPGATPLFRLVNLNSMYVEASVPEEYLPQVKRNTGVVVHFDALNQEYTSKVRRVNNTIDPNSRTFMIEVSVPNKRGLIKPNLIANLQLNDYTNDKAVLIPNYMVQENADGDQFVYIVDQLGEDNRGMVKQVQIEVGNSTDDGMIEVLTGLTGAEQIIGEGARTLQDGDEIEVQV